jgi:hypothetical protein
VLVIVTDACGITAPLGSVTAPVIVPVSKVLAPCPIAVRANPKIMHTSAAAKRRPELVDPQMYVRDEFNCRSSAMIAS